MTDRTHAGKDPLGALNPATVTAAKTKEGNVDILAFPSNLQAHSFLMNFVDYKYDPDADSVQNTALSVAFPVPQQINSKEDLRYNQQDMGTAGAIAADGIDQLKKVFDKTGGSNGTEGNKNIDFAQLSSDAVGAGGALLRANAPAPLQQGASVALGNVVNPHVALLFEGVNLKTFTFQWRFSPDNEGESILLKKILNKIKKHIYPRFTQSGENNFYLRFPHQVDLYYTGSKDFLHYFKRASVTSMETNFTPEGVSFFQGGAPTMIDVTMGFQESEIWTSEDFDE
jgi:hypothetical protein